MTDQEKLLSGHITEGWLKSVGFKWSQFDRQPTKQWTLWLGGCQDCGNQWHFSGAEDLGIELALNGPDNNFWFCWLRSDSSRRYHRFIHVRHLTTQDQVIKLVEAMTGFPWNPANHLYGSALCQKCADRATERQGRLDQKLLQNAYPWTEHEKDGTRGRPLIEHVDAATKGGLAK